MPNIDSRASGRNALARLRSRQPVYGLVQTIPEPTMTELAVWSGFDFVLIDCEHSLIDERAQLGCLQTVSGSDAFAVVRVRAGDLSAVGRYLEYGAAGIMLPDVQTAAEAAAFVAAATYGPEGTRSSTSLGTRATRYGLSRPSDVPHPFLLAMIEGARAVAEIDAIASTRGLEGLMIGSHDLSADLGCAGDYSNSAYTDAFAKIERAATRAGLLLGSGAHPGFPLERLLAAGHCFIIAGVDFHAVREGYRLQLKAARGA